MLEGAAPLTEFQVRAGTATRADLDARHARCTFLTAKGDLVISRLREINSRPRTRIKLVQLVLCRDKLRETMPRPTFVGVL